MLLGSVAQYFFGISIFVLSLFLILLVLVQRGRGGGLTGALGGPGGQSAFGTRAGDVFTRVTIVVATIWIFLCAASVLFLRSRGRPTLNAAPSLPALSSPEVGGGTAEPEMPPAEESADGSAELADDSGDAEQVGDRSSDTPSTPGAQPQPDQPQPDQPQPDQPQPDQSQPDQSQTTEPQNRPATSEPAAQADDSPTE